MWSWTVTTVMLNLTQEVTVKFLLCAHARRIGIQAARCEVEEAGVPFAPQVGDSCSSSFLSTQVHHGK